MVIEIGERRIDLLGPQVGMLPEDLLGGPAVVVMFAREVDHLVSRLSHPRGAVRVEAEMRIMDDRAHGKGPPIPRAGLARTGRGLSRPADLSRRRAYHDRDL